jgi:arginine exporter protein ArgO
MTALQAVIILLLGIVFLMTNKPSLIGSLIVMGIALVLGLALGALTSRVMRTQKQETPTQTSA